jgi:acyl-CoA reductase-like NAD-dependent aldehyde dehydrogenase
VTDAVAKGARALVGGSRQLSDTGQYFAPTVLADVTPEMEIMKRETFGPVMVLSRVWNEREAIERANDTPFGLGATVLTKSRVRAKRIQSAIVSGSASINDFGMTYMAMDLPFGGARNSGFGRLNGREGLRACCNVKSVLYDRLPLHQPAKLYPVGPRDYGVARSVIRALYGRGARRRLNGAAELVGALLKRSS